ncbi:hypothetical protein WME91_42140 [Sorangium sp. So ce269]
MLEFTANAQRFKNVPLSPLAFLEEQIVQQNPLAAPVWLAGLAAALVTERGRPGRVLGLVYMTALVVFVAAKAKAYYLAPAYPMLFAAGGVAVEGWSRRLHWAAAGLAVAGGVIGLPLAIPVLPRDTFIRYAAALGVGAQSSGEQHETGKLPQFYADMHGWPEMARVHAALPDEERKTCGIFAQNYGEAGAIDLFGPAHGLPKAIAGHNSYWLWGPRDVSGQCVVVIGGNRETMLEVFEEVEVAGRIEHEWAMPYENVPVHVGRRSRTPLSELWPRVKHYE